jgi:hypothetical protein
MYVLSLRAAAYQVFHYGTRLIVLVQNPDIGVPILRGDASRIGSYCLKNHQVRFGGRIALTQGVRHKAQAQGETIESALFPTPLRHLC